MRDKEFHSAAVPSTVRKALDDVSLSVVARAFLVAVRRTEASGSVELPDGTWMKFERGFLHNEAGDAPALSLPRGKRYEFRHGECLGQKK